MTHPLQLRIRAVGRRAGLWMLLRATCWTVVCVLTGTFLVGILDFLFAVQDTGIRVIGSLSVLAIGVLATRRFLMPVFSVLSTRSNDVQTARQIERSCPDWQDRLSSTIAFLEQSEEDATAGSAELRRAVIAKATSDLEQIDLSSAIDNRPSLRTLCVMLIVGLAITTVCSLDLASTGRAARRMAMPWSTDGWHQLELLEAPKRLALGGTFAVRVGDRNGNLPRSIHIQYWFDGDGKDAIREEVMEREDNFAIHHLPSVTRSFQFRAIGGDDRSMSWTPVHVVVPPQIVDLQMKLYPPGYTEWPVADAPLPIRALHGTRIAIQGSSSKPLQAASVRIDVGSAVREFPAVVAEDGRRFSLGPDAARPWVVEESGTYWFELLGRDGMTGASKDRRDLRVIPHRTPKVSLREPSTHLFVTPRALIPIVADVREDIAIHFVQLQLFRSDLSEQGETTIDIYRGPEHSARIPTPAPIFLTQDAGRQTYQFNWNLAELDNLATGVRIDFRVLATNYKPLEGQSESRRLTLISDDELLDRIAQRQRYILHELAEVTRAQRDARGQTAALQIQLRDAGDLRPQDVDRLQNAILHQRDIVRRLSSDERSIHSEVISVIRQLEKNRVQRPEIEQRIRKLLNALQEIEQSNLEAIQRHFGVALKHARSLQSDDDKSFAPEKSAELPRVSANNEQSPLSVALQQVGHQQEGVIEQLEWLHRQLTNWDNYRQFARDIRQLIRDQEQITQHTGDVRWRTVARDELTSQERADLRKLARAQHDMANRLDRIQGRMDDMRHFLLSTDPTAAGTIENALDLAARNAIHGKMQKSGRLIDNIQAGNANTLQKTIAEHLQELHDILSHRAERKVEQRVRQLREAAEELDRALRQRKELETQLDGQERPTNPLRSQSDVQRLLKDVADLQRQISRLSRRLKRLQAERAAASLQRASTKLQRLAKSTEQGNAEDARQEAQHAQSDLEAARRQLEKDIRQAEQELMQEQLARLEDGIEALIEQQHAVMQEMERLDQIKNTQGQWAPGQGSSVRTLAAQQGGLADETTRLAEKLVDAVVVHFGLAAAARKMIQVSHRLDQADTGKRTQQTASGAARQLEQLQQAFQEEESDAGASQGTADGASDSAQPSPTNSTGLVELNLLKLMQQDLHYRTETFDLERPSTGTLSEEQRLELEQLSNEQNRLADLLFRLFQPTEQREPE